MKSKIEEIVKDFFPEAITDQEYIDLVKLWESNDPIDSNEMVDMIEYCIAKFDVTISTKADVAKESGEQGDVIEVNLPKEE